jgi:biotin synthase
MNKKDILEMAKRAKESGSTRFCMGAAWRDMRGRRTHFATILECVHEVQKLNMEVCCTLGMLEEGQAEALKAAGLTAYNHNLDSSREFYPKIITTRTYDERLATLEKVRKAGLNVCCGGIIGMGETHADRIAMLHTLATLPEHPESVPINMLLSVKGTALQDRKVV